MLRAGGLVRCFASGAFGLAVRLGGGGDGEASGKTLGMVERAAAGAFALGGVSGLVDSLATATTDGRAGSIGPALCVVSALEGVEGCLMTK